MILHLPDTTPRPIDVTEERAEWYKALALMNLESVGAKVHWGRKQRPGFAWLTTGQVDVPGWVLTELWAEGKVLWKKHGASEPNRWRHRS